VVTYDLPLDVTYKYKIVSDFCKKNNIRYTKFSSFNEDLINQIEKINPDLIITCYFRKIIPKKIINLTKNIINLHPSYLPYYRGPVPTAWAILNNDKYSGFTIHEIDSGIDTGKIIKRKKILISKNDTGYTLYKKGMDLGYNMFKKNFDIIINKKYKPKSQNKFGSYFGKLEVEQFINWQYKTSHILNLIRVYSYPYNSAKSKIFNKYLLIDKAEIYRDKKILAQKPGKIEKIVNGKFPVISCSDGLIILKKFIFVKPLNKKEKNIYLKVGNVLES
jgi:methionyl-tRNA formyltransferase